MTSLFYFHKCKVFLNTTGSTQLLLTFAVQMYKVYFNYFKLCTVKEQKLYAYLWNCILT